jgi:DNA-binding winged helix-turn-helix (wHTH) protein/Tol biopolymer transport system component
MDLASRRPECYEFGPFRLDANEHELNCDGAPVPLPGKAFELLLILVRRAGRTVGKEELVNALWPDTAVEEANLTQTIFVLRRALGEGDDESVYIATVPRRGYKFVAKVAPSEEGSRDVVQPAVVYRRRWIWPAAATVAGFFVAAGIAILWIRQPGRLDFSAYRYQPFAYSDETESGGVWSPDGKSIAFIKGSPGAGLNPGRLMVQAADSATALQLVERASVPIAWSPDGSKIFFDAGPKGVNVVSRSGGQIEPVLGGVFFFDLSSDGKTMAVWKVVRRQDGSVRGSVWLSSPPGAEPHEYLPAPFAVPASYVPVYLRFSPNSRLLYLSTTAASGVNETWLLPLPPGNGQPRRLFPSVSWSRPVSASWMPDSRHMVLSSNIAPRGSYSLWVGDTRTNSLTKLDDSSNEQTEPAVSPDGKRILLTRLTIRSDIFELPLDGSAPRKLLATSLPEFSPSWSPKGDEFAYVTQRTGSYELWVHSSQGEWDRPLVTGREISNLGDLSAPAISPDGTRVAYLVNLAPQRGIYVSPIGGGPPNLLVPRAASPTWSPDGTSIGFVWTNSKGASHLATLRLCANQQPFDILPNPCTSPPEWSPSGEWIACDTRKGPLLVSPDGKLTRTLRPLDASVMAWSGDSRALYALSLRNGRLKLVAEQVSTKAVREVSDYGSELRPYWGRINGAQRMSLAPNAKSFALGLGGIQSDLWILDGAVK